MEFYLSLKVLTKTAFLLGQDAARKRSSKAVTIYIRKSDNTYTAESFTGKLIRKYFYAGVNSVDHRRV